MVVVVVGGGEVSILPALPPPGSFALSCASTDGRRARPPLASRPDEPPSDDGVFVSEPAFGRFLTRKTRERALGRRPPEPSPSPPEPGDVTLRVGLAAAAARQLRPARQIQKSRRR